MTVTVTLGCKLSSFYHLYLLFYYFVGCFWGKNRVNKLYAFYPSRNAVTQN